MKTESKLEKGFRKIIDFEVEDQEIDEYRKNAFRKFRKTAKIDGFRPGKAPEHLIRQRYGGSIEADALNDTISDLYHKYIMENKIYPIAEPVIENIDKQDGILKFTAVVEIFPEFELLDYEGYTVEHEKDVVSDEEVDKVIGDILDKHASSKEIGEPVSKGNLVDVSIRPVSDKEEEWHSRTVEAGFNPDDVIESSIAGLKKGDTTIVKWPMPQLNTDMEIEVRIDKVGEKVLPEFNDDFAKAYDSKYSDAEDMRSSIRTDLEEGRKEASQNAIYDKIARKIIEKHDNFDVPPSVLNKYVANLIENAKKTYGKAVNDEALKNLYGADAEKSLKWEYLRHRIIEKEELKVTDEDIENRLGEIAEKSRIEISKVKEYYSPKEKDGMLREDILNGKLRNMLIERNSIILTDPLPAEKENNDNE